MAGSALRKRQLGRELERLRKAATLTQGQAAATLDCSTAKIAHFESGRNLPQRAELILLLQTYAADEGTYPVLDEIRQEAAKPSWWNTSRLPEWITAYVGLESDATAMRSVERELIPGLLQTEAYIRALHIVGGSERPPDELDRLIMARLRRQERLNEAKPLHFSVVISEAALIRCAHSAVGSGQLTQLYERAQWPNIEVYVMPLRFGLYSSGQFAVLSFPHGLLDDVAYEENTVGHIIEDTAAVRRLDTVYSKVRDQALDTRASLTMLAEFARK